MSWRIWGFFRKLNSNETCLQTESYTIIFSKKIDRRKQAIEKLAESEKSKIVYHFFLGNWSVPLSLTSRLDFKVNNFSLNETCFLVNKTVPLVISIMIKIWFILFFNKIIWPWDNFEMRP